MERARTDASGARKRASVKESDFGALNVRVSRIRRTRPDDELASADAAVVWARLSSGYRIVELQLDRFVAALHFVLDHYCRTEPLCQAVGLHKDAVSMKSLMHNVFEKMESMMSFVAIREGTNDLVGVLVASLFDRTDLQASKEVRDLSSLFFQKGEMQEGETLHQVMLLRSHAAAKAEYYGAMEAERSVRVDILCVQADHQRKGIGTALLRSCVARAGSFASACVGEFTSGAGQTLARRLEFDVLYELPYKCLELADHRLQIFQFCHPDNYSIACMAVRVSSPPHHRAPVAPEQSVTVAEPSRKEKNATKKKVSRI